MKSQEQFVLQMQPDYQNSRNDIPPLNIDNTVSFFPSELICSLLISNSLIIN